MDHLGPQKRVFPSKGVHIYLPQISKDKGYSSRTTRQARVLYYAIGEYSLVGTTDTPLWRSK